jgi:glycosyltransferase involved in cell wall biosynthesis
MTAGRAADRRVSVSAPMHPTSAAAPAPPVEQPARMRILHAVCHSHRRGSEMAALELGDELDGSGHHNRLVAMGPALDGGRDPDLPPLGRSWREGPTELVSLAWRLRRLLSEEAVDVVLAHGSWPAAVAALAVPRHGPLLVWQRIGMLPDKVWGPVRRRWWGSVAQRCHASVVLSADQEVELRRLGFDGPVWVIPNFRNPGRFRDVDRDAAAAGLRVEIGVSAETHLIGVVGALSPEKRFDRALEVLALLATQGCSAHLVVAGSGQMRAELEAHADRLGVAESVTLLGHRFDVERILAGVDLALLTSETECMPGVSVEALMAGCPMVTVPVVGVDRVVEHGATGLVLDGFEPPEMADAVARLLTDDESRAAMSREARARTDRFSASTAASVYTDRLSAALAGR